MSGTNGVADLEKKFRGSGLSFRHFPNGRLEILRWQVGRIEVERITVMQEHLGGRAEPVELEVERFRLLAYAATPAELAEKLEQLPNGAQPRYRELLDA